MFRSTSAAIADFGAGLKVVVPILFSMVAFGMVTGVLGVRLGLSPLATSGMSLFIFAGSAQVAALQLFHELAPPMVVLVTVLFINLRFSIYSASLAPHFHDQKHWRRALVAYLLTDQAYIVSLLGFQKEPEMHSRLAYFLGAAVPIWLTWQIGTVAGALTGAHLPNSWGLELAAPLTFLALMFSAIRNRPGLVAAIVSGIVAVAASDIPWHLGMLAGAAAGVTAAMLTPEREQDHG